MERVEVISDIDWSFTSVVSIKNTNPTIDYSDEQEVYVSIKNKIQLQLECRSRCFRSHQIWIRFEEKNERCEKERRNGIFEEKK